MTTTLKMKAGAYSVHHAGRMLYTVTDGGGEVVGTFSNLSQATWHAIRCHDADKNVILSALMQKEEAQRAAINASHT